MTAVMINCPETDRPVHTGQHVTRSNFEAAEFTGASFRCSACNRIHRWEKGQAWMVQSRSTAPA